MVEIEELKLLLDQNGPAIPLNILARYCGCTRTSIQNYIQGKSIPSGTKLLGIRKGLKEYKETINKIIKE